MLFVILFLGHVLVPLCESQTLLGVITDLLPAKQNAASVSNIVNVLHGTEGTAVHDRSIFLISYFENVSIISVLESKTAQYLSPLQHL